MSVNQGGGRVRDLVKHQLKVKSSKLRVTSYELQA